MALTHHNAAHGNERRRREAEHLRAEARRNGHVTAVAEAPIRLEANTAAQAVEDERLVRLGNAELEGQTSVLDPSPARGASAAIVSRNEDMVRLGLGHAGRNHADAHLRDELDRNVRRTVGILQVKNELSKIFD